MTFHGKSSLGHGVGLLDGRVVVEVEVAEGEEGALPRLQRQLARPEDNTHKMNILVNTVDD